MTTRIYESQYKDQPALTIESAAIRAQFLPGTGAKMASLVYKPAPAELLVQAPGEKYLLQPFDGDYVSGECSGFDDMFPTIDLCYYDRFPWEGTKMADHGEVWSLPWECRTEADGFRFTVHGVRFPYRLEKQVRFAGDSVLHLGYRLTNLSPCPFDFLWAAHMMFNLEEGTELVLPDGIQGIVGTFGLTGNFGTYGDEYAWPFGTLPDGSQRDWRQLRPRSASDAYKYYIKGRMPAGWAALKYHRSGHSLALSFPVTQVPYFGVLPNEGGWRGYYNIFLEPCTTPFDRPDAGRYRGQVATLQAHAAYEWHLNITLAAGTDFRSVSEDGELTR
jgi:Aldose 1-epimerase